MIGAILIPLALLLLGLWYLFSHPTLFPRALPQGATLLSNSLHGPKKLSDGEYEILRDQLFDIVNGQNPKVALEKLSESMDTSPSVLRSCHAFVHEIGHEAYRKYKDVGNALRYSDELCGSGYLHGIIEEYFNNTVDPFSRMKTLCDSSDFTRQYDVCHHAVGHGLMYFTGNNLPLSIEKCDAYNIPRERTRCAEGVYMENFNTDQKLHPSRYLNPDDPFYPCASQPAYYKAICYFYAPIYFLSLHNDDYVGAMRWCQSAPKGYPSACTDGLATRIMKQNINNPKLVEQVCVSGVKKQVNPCIDGMVSYYVVNFNSASSARNMCQKLSPEHRGQCLRSVNARRSLFVE